jgi:hypothetical protein
MCSVAALISACVAECDEGSKGGGERGVLTMMAPCLLVQCAGHPVGPAKTIGWLFV